MVTIHLFHKIYGRVHELPDRGAFPYERELQQLFEEHLRTLTGIHFLASEYSTGQRHDRRIDTLGMDEACSPVVIEYKRSQDDNVINQDLEHLDWLENHQADFRELVRETLGNVPGVDCGKARLMCIASEFPPRDEVSARHCSRRIDLVRYRRYGDEFIALEWVYGGDAGKPASSRPAVSPRRTGSEERTALPPERAERRTRDDEYSIYPPWARTSEGTRTLFRKLKKLVESLGSVKTDAFKSEMSFKCLEVTGRQAVIA